MGETGETGEVGRWAHQLSVRIRPARSQRTCSTSCCPASVARRWARRPGNDSKPPTHGAANDARHQGHRWRTFRPADSAGYLSSGVWSDTTGLDLGTRWGTGGLGRRGGAAELVLAARHVRQRMGGRRRSSWAISTTAGAAIPSSIRARGAWRGWSRSRSSSP